MNRLLLLTIILVSLTVRAHDLEVKNADGVTIYYNYMNDGTELQVTYAGNYPYDVLPQYLYKGSVVIPNIVTFMNRIFQVTSIGELAFYKCSDLTSVTIPSSVSSIGENAFYSCSRLTSMTIPDGVTSIEEGTFHKCSRLTFVSIPNSVTSMGDYAFYECSGLTSITIPSNMTTIGRGIFSGCSGLTSVSIPNGVTSIGSHAFGGCFGMNSVAIPNSVTTIGEGAFEGCSRLTSITIPSSVTSIESYAFQDCTRLTSIVVNDMNPVYDSRNGCNAIVETKSNVLIMGCQTSTIPSSVTAIGDNAFNRCTNLASITIPGNVTSLGTNAFRGCSGLKKVIISNMAAWCRISINNYLASPLYYSHHLYDENDIEIKDLVIPSDVTSINDYTFYGCTSLTSVTIPGSVTSIGKSVFKDIDIPTVVTLIANPFDIYGESSLFAAFNQNTFKNATLYVPKGTVELYKATEGWKDFKFIEEDNSHSSIESVRDEDPGGHDYYDLGGRKISTPKKGLHINRGSKVIVK